MKEIPILAITKSFLGQPYHAKYLFFSSGICKMHVCVCLNFKMKFKKVSCHIPHVIFLSLWELVEKSRCWPQIMLSEVPSSLSVCTGGRLPKGLIVKGISFTEKGIWIVSHWLLDCKGDIGTCAYLGLFQFVPRQIRSR